MRDRYLDLREGRGGIEGVGERGHGAHKRQNRNRKGEQSVGSVPE